ncbi:uncharacterized protein ANIA_10587 [Aspergillus nidulans FGSC A4]|uniref:Uncharacterized protein n=1 Tax=Emericella nidulans (strain FGSC A4 / ATCC 38163 / CBS 112.46 / NRRL 194 / M139) TaxID=227321 RepID=C8VAZ9_EMENI|nr:hypothetical protein [Aspergillus nidulans FGSC A4]CBF77014.1 TPA: conserved hypothetical protein [Aspergillus nidulans FGSC A4]
MRVAAWAFIRHVEMVANQGFSPPGPSVSLGSSLGSCTLIGTLFDRIPTRACFLSGCGICKNLTTGLGLAGLRFSSVRARLQMTSTSHPFFWFTAISVFPFRVSWSSLVIITSAIHYSQRRSPRTTLANTLYTHTAYLDRAVDGPLL